MSDFGLDRKRMTPARDVTWDVIVIGAGPAGALAAYLLAKQSLRTLLVEKSEFPRDKICGGCVNRRALDLLSRVGLGQLCDDLGAPTVRRMQLRYSRASADVSLPMCRAVSRRTFDAALVDYAMAAGAEFWTGSKASVLPCESSTFDPPHREVAIQQMDQPEQRISARTVLVCDGLGHPSLNRLSEFHTVVRKRALVGLGAQLTRSAWHVPTGTITMDVGHSGYVGAVQVDGDGLSIAAAVDLRVIRALGAGGAIEAILRGAGHATAGLEGVIWRGTRPLTCDARQVAAARLFLLGDAAGYVEPFTGEGIAWALASSLAVVPLARQSCEAWRPELAVAWQQFHRQMKQRDQRICRIVTRLLRRPLIASSTVRILSLWPEMAAPLVHHVNGSK